MSVSLDLSARIFSGEVGGWGGGQNLRVNSGKIAITQVHFGRSLKFRSLDPVEWVTAAGCYRAVEKMSKPP